LKCRDCWYALEVVERSHTRVVFALAMLLVPSACSVLVSTSGLAGGAADEGDGGPSTDAPLDRTATESGSDAGAEGGTKVDAAGPFCAQRDAAFCADFDGVDLATGWTDTVLAGGTLARKGEAVSAPFALRAETPPTTSMSAAAARLWWQTAVPHAVHVELDVRFTDSPVGYFEMAKIEFPTSFEPDSPTSGSAAIEIGSQGSGKISASAEGWNEGGTHYSTPFTGTASPAVGAWVHVVVDATLGTTGSLRITLDGQPTVDVQGVRTLPAGVTAMRIVIGPFVDSNPLPTVTSYDNVLVDVTP
jgi:hypothetical protein